MQSYSEELEVRTSTYEFRRDRVQPTTDLFLDRVSVSCRKQTQNFFNPYLVYKTHESPVPPAPKIELRGKGESLESLPSDHIGPLFNTHMISLFHWRLRCAPCGSSPSKWPGVREAHTLRVTAGTRASSRLLSLFVYVNISRAVHTLHMSPSINLHTPTRISNPH